MKERKLLCSVGGNHYVENFMELSDDNPDYSSKNFKDSAAVGEKVYRYSFAPNCRVSLIPEPDNKYDPNAIRVEVARKKLGYISRKETGKAREYLSKCNPSLITGNIYGGPYKKLTDDMRIEKGTDTYYVEIEFVIGTSPQKIVQKSEPRRGLFGLFRKKK